MRPTSTPPTCGWRGPGSRCGRRVGGDDAGWHLKLPIDADTRHEMRMALGRNKLRPPARFVALTRVHTRGARSSRSRSC